MPEYELVQPFDTDSGELDGLSQAECFAMGVEWQMFRAQLETGKPFNTVVLASNAKRLTKMAERCQRFVEHRPAENGWSLITVGDQLV